MKAKWGESSIPRQVGEEGAASSGSQSACYAGYFQENPTSHKFFFIAFLNFSFVSKNNIIK